MGQVNQPSNLLDRLKRFERELQRLWKAVGLASATIARGGLTLIQDAFLRMVDDNGHEIVYIGPDAEGKQIFRLRREGGNLMMYTAGNAQFGRDFWAFTDSNGRVIVSDDAETGHGMARPWLPLVLYAAFVPNTGDGQTGELTYYWNLDSDELVGEQTIWRGWTSVQHPWLRIRGTWGRASGDVTATYRVLFDNVEVYSWTTSTFDSYEWSPRIDVRDWVGTDYVNVEITASATGTGVVACQYWGGYLL